MSNNAIRILYSSLNAIPGVRCERVFVPASDFEQILRDTQTPLYTLESGIPLHEVDILAFSIGYELCATNILTVLDLGRISLDAAGRASNEPVVIAGGPAVTNPHPLSRFLDAVWIGEAEAGFFSLVEDIARTKKSGIGRQHILERLQSESAVWMKGKKAYRAIDTGFSDRVYDISFPWPSIKPVQDHGTVEIMRGCPNGCRFCHAGFFYRPQRVRSPQIIFQEVEDLVQKSGYREITLASLSSGDYPDLASLIHELNDRWASRRVSFQLPSLKVESFTLPILSELAQTRKSGLTFAVETPEKAWQRSINKDVTLEKTLAILEEARLKGYRLAKFYFMLGLPLPDSKISEAESIVSFLHILLEKTSFQLNVNLGTFIPKPHTPFQWCRQIEEEEAFSRINYIRSAFRSERRIKISYHSPFTSTLEGLLSRGDSRVGDLILDAWKRGARLDAWEDLLNKEAWRQALLLAPQPLLQEALGERPSDSFLPWDDVSLRVGKGFLLKELERSEESISSSGCSENCSEPCGTCNNEISVQKKTTSRILARLANALPSPEASSGKTKSTYRMIFRFEKTGSSSYLPHHAIIDLLYRAIQLGNIPVLFSEGFNPLPRLEIEEPLPLGMESKDDYFSIVIFKSLDNSETVKTLNQYLPSGMNIIESSCYSIPEGCKNKSLSSIYWGSDYLINSFESRHIDSFTEYLSDPRLYGSSVQKTLLDEEAFLHLHLKAGGKREVGFGSIFERVYGMPFSQSPMRVQRIHQWADIGNGPVAFLDALASLYRKSDIVID